MFIGRDKELNLLYKVYNSTAFSFGIVHGRRRVGKTTLLKHSIQNHKALYFLAHQANKQMNLDLFSHVYARYKGMGKTVYESFYDLFNALFQEENLIVIIDEFTYLTEIDPSFESVLQGLIDAHHETSSLKMIVSGSEIGMFENLFSHSRPLFNRHTFTLHLKECDYRESAHYYPHFSDADKIRLYTIFGGLPYYMRLIDDKLSVKENICQLVLDDHARLASEVSMLLTTELRSIQEYQSVLQAIHSGGTKLSTIDSKSRIHNTAKTSKYVKKLIQLELIEKEHRFLDAPNTKKHLYRIKNNFFAFYYHFIWRHASAKVMMDPSDFYDLFIADELDNYVSLRFESVCAQYLLANFKARHGLPIIQIGRYWYNDRVLQKDVEIDLCVQTQQGTVIYECKWTQTPVTHRVMKALSDKGTTLNAIAYGAFSRSGFTTDIQNQDFDLVSLEDLFNADSKLR